MFSEDYRTWVRLAKKDCFDQRRADNLILRRRECWDGKMFSEDYKTWVRFAKKYCFDQRWLHNLILWKSEYWGGKMLSEDYRSWGFWVLVPPNFLVLIDFNLPKNFESTTWILMRCNGLYKISYGIKCTLFSIYLVVFWD